MRPPMRSSTDEPKTNSMSMLNRMCGMPACRNMYVMNVHGYCQACAGENPNAPTKLGEVNNVL